jgi:hypothetical protein
LVIVFRNASPNPKDKGFIAWIGTYNDIKQAKPGQYRVSLLKTLKDGFYPVSTFCPMGPLLPPHTPITREEDVGCSIVSVRFKISEVDAMVKSGGVGAVRK